MSVNSVPTAGPFPTKFNKREAKVIETCQEATGTLKNKTLDSTCTVAGSTVAAASVALSKLADASAAANVIVADASKKWQAVALSGDATISNVGALTVASGAITLAKLATAVKASHVVKFAQIGTTITGTTLTGVLTDDICITLTPGVGGVAALDIKTAVADNTLPTDPADTDWVIVLRATA